MKKNRFIKKVFLSFALVAAMTLGFFNNALAANVTKSLGFEAGPHPEIIPLNVTITSSQDSSSAYSFHADYAPYNGVIPMGYVARYCWDFGDGTRSYEASPSHLYDKPGEYTVSLFITLEKQGSFIGYRGEATKVINNDVSQVSIVK